MFRVVANSEYHARGKLQAALLEEMDNLRRSIEQSMCTLEAEIEKRTHARIVEASHSRAGDASTEDLRQELGSLREHVLRELDGMQSKDARSTPQLTKTKTMVTPPGTAQSEADLPGDASKACSPGGDKEGCIEKALRMLGCVWSK